MADQERLLGYLALVTASLARDLEEAGLLSDASRKSIHTGLGEIRGSADEVAAFAAPDDELRLALRIMDGIAPAADG